ncbi:MAG TPA: nicotinate-nucleotide--dimethylbenzimidazole phosphoribosyltransferase [Desulfobacteria bacterium]|nr:nicotinate-nucleotide--dimethylbenzimidazole phosphoribosyltransferase [Desulfobacteria bacterium]
MGDWINELLDTIDISLPDNQAKRQILEKLNKLCKTNGGLGEIETILTKLAGIQGDKVLSTGRAVIVFAADHGVTAEGVSKFCSSDSMKMTVAILKGESAVGCLAEQMGIPLFCWDVGLKDSVPESTAYVHTLQRAKVAYGTRNFVNGPAMGDQELRAALERGRQAVHQLPQDIRLVALGEMGMGNTTSAAALAAVLLNVLPEKVVGGGAGYADIGHKVTVIERALRNNGFCLPVEITPGRVVEVLKTFGGIEIAALTGACLEAALDRRTVILDGFVTTVAAFIAFLLKPAVVNYLLPSHLALEPGHRLLLNKLGLRPVLNLELKVGEGAGGLLLFPLIDSGIVLLEQMASFAELGISGVTTKHYQSYDRLDSNQ